MIYRGPDFLAFSLRVIWLLHHTHPPFPPASCLFCCVLPAEFTDRRGERVGRSQIMLQRGANAWSSINFCLHHGLINYKDTKTKCRHPKKLTCKGTLRRCLLEFIDRRSVSHVSIFDPALWTSAPLTFSLVHLTPSPFPVSKYSI